jgi:hypothetical protein
MLMAVKRSDTALKRQTVHLRETVVDDSLWQCLSSNLGLPHFGGRLNAIYVETVPVGAKMWRVYLQ